MLHKAGDSCAKFEQLIDVGPT